MMIPRWFVFALRKFRPVVLSDAYCEHGVAFPSYGCPACQYVHAKGQQSFTNLMRDLDELERNGESGDAHRARLDAWHIPTSGPGARPDTLEQWTVRHVSLGHHPTPGDYGYVECSCGSLYRSRAIKK